ncbi:MAG: DNA topology modulation protein FlaR [Lachnospiraceae bacterium]|nr:DNA topology modulation protein FlaR [Lachnospiraceae bacterium]
MKIHIIGCSGTGKTYLAKKLSKKYNIQHYDLDDIQWDNSADGYGLKMPVNKREELLKQILNQESWIIEGVYYAWVTESFQMADVIYILDLPSYIYKYRIIIRFIKRKLGIEKGKNETFKSVYNLLKWTGKYQNNNLKEIKKILKEYESKVIWISDSREIDKIIKG